MMWEYGLSWPGMFIMMTLGSLLWVALIAVIVWASMNFLNKKESSSIQTSIEFDSHGSFRKPGFPEASSEGHWHDWLHSCDASFLLLDSNHDSNERS